MMINALLVASATVFPLQETAGEEWTFKPFRIHEGEHQEHALGFYVHTCGDVDSDGVEDYLIGAPGAAKDGKQVGGAELRSGKDGTLIRSLFGPHESSNFGRIALGVGDVDLDGVADFAVSATRDSSKIEEGGSLSIFSGKTGSVLHQWFGDEAFDKFGRSLALVEDLDSDGVNDVLVGGYQPSGLHEQGRGYVRLYSAKTGKLLKSLRGQRPRDMFGVSMANVGDLTGDGVGDFAVGSFYAREQKKGRQPSQGSVSCFDGNSGELLWRSFASDFMEMENVKNNPTYGRKVCAVGDLNDDGFADVLASAPLWDKNGEPKKDNRGLVVALSGKDGRPIPNLRAEGFGRGSGLGHSLAAMGDVDGDGVGDFLIGAMAGGYVELRSGKQFKLLGRVRGESNKSMFAQSLRSAGDLDGDGISEVIIGEPAGSAKGGKKSGRVTIFNLIGH